MRLVLLLLPLKDEKLNIAKLRFYKVKLRFKSKPLIPVLILTTTVTFRKSTLKRSED